MAIPTTPAPTESWVGALVDAYWRTLVVALPRSPCVEVKTRLANEKLPCEVANNKQQSKHNQTNQ